MITEGTPGPRPDMSSRPTWEEYFMSIAEQVAGRSTCIRRHVGAVVVKDKRLLTTGYNGVPSGIEHCTTRGCLRDQLGIPSGQRHELCRGTHAEQNALLQSARYGTPIDGSTLYCTTQPCAQCAKMIINAGIKELVFKGAYPDDLALELLKEAGITLTVFGSEQV